MGYCICEYVQVPIEEGRNVNWIKVRCNSTHYAGFIILDRVDTIEEVDKLLFMSKLQDKQLVVYDEETGEPIHVKEIYR